MPRPAGGGPREDPEKQVADACGRQRRAGLEGEPPLPAAANEVLCKSGEGRALPELSRKGAVARQTI